MKTKAMILTASVTLIAAGVVAIFATATSRATASQTRISEAHGDEPWTFKEGRGITLSESTRRAIGVSVAPVESARILPEPEGLSAQIYSTAAESTDQRTSSASLWVPPALAATLSVGQEVEISKGRSEFHATIAAVKAPHQAGASTEVLLHVQDAKAQLRVGDFLKVRLGQDAFQQREATTIPASAVVESVRGDFVYAVNGSAFLRTPVVLGARQGDRVEVVDGLFEGDEVVAAGASHLWMIELQAVNGGKGCADGH